MANLQRAERAERRPGPALWGPLLTGAVGIAAVGTLALRDPHRPGSYGICPLFLFTGWYCPGCGGLRAVNDLAHLRIVDAVGSNALAVAIVVVGTLGWCAWLVAAAGGPRLNLERVATPARLWVGLALLVAFSVLRNTPWGAWLAPGV